MGSISKSFSLLLIVILVITSLMIVKPAFAQTIPKPSVPEFSLKYIDLSYDVPPTYGIDQFTGKTVITQEGHHVDNQSIEFKIKNQAFTSYTDSIGNNISLSYNFRFKGHFGNEWSYYPFSESGLSTGRYSAMFYYFADFPNFKASTSDYSDFSTALTHLFAQSPSAGSQIDVQVQAQIGHIDSLGDGFYSFTGQSSGWSNTQTITIGETSTSTSPNPTPTVPEFTWLAILPLFISLLSVAVIFKFRHRKTSISGK